MSDWISVSGITARAEVADINLGLVTKEMDPGKGRKTRTKLWDTLVLEASREGGAWGGGSGVNQECGRDPRE